MPYSYDFFAGQLKCPVCGTISAPDDSTEIYTYIRTESNAELLKVGSPLHVDVRDIEQNSCDGYYTVKVPEPGESIRLLNPWRCSSCGAYNWAEIELYDDTIVNMVNVILDGATLRRNHLISNESDYVAADLLGISWTDFKNVDTVQTLLTMLP